MLCFSPFHVPMCFRTNTRIWQALIIAIPPNHPPFHLGSGDQDKEERQSSIKSVLNRGEREDISWRWDFRVFERKWDAEYDRAPWISGWPSLKSAQRPL